MAHARARALQREHQAALDVVLRPPQLLFAQELPAHPPDLLEGQADHLGRRVEARPRVDAEEPRVGVGGEARGDRVHEPALLPDVLEEARGHRAAEDGVEHVAGVAIGVRLRVGPGPEADVHLLELVLRARDGAGGDAGGVAVPRRPAAVQPREVPAHQGRHRPVLQVPRGGDQDVRGVVHAREVGREILAPEAPHGLLGSQDGPAERVVRPERLREELHDEVVGGVLDHVDLFEDDLLLLGHLRGVEERVEDDVAEDLDREGQVLVEHLEVERGVLLGGEGVHVAADRVHLGRDALRRAGLRALEDHVLDEVADAAHLVGLVPASPLEPHPHRHAAQRGHGLGHEGEAVRERFLDDHFGGCAVARDGGVQTSTC